MWLSWSPVVLGAALLLWGLVNGCGEGQVNYEIKAANSNARLQIKSVGRDLNFIIVHGTSYQAFRVPNTQLTLIGSDATGVQFRVGTSGSFSLTVQTDEANLFLLKLSWLNLSGPLRDCKQLEPSTLHWYGGPQQRNQQWPIEKLRFSDYSYVTKEADNCGVAERYFLNSDGIFYYIDSAAPLFLDITDTELCFVSKLALPYNVRQTTFSYEYVIGVSPDVKTAHMQAVAKFLGKPDAVVDQTMAKLPIWSTWAKYKAAIDQNIVLAFAQEILDNGFEKSQLEIDDLWETCYGSLTFDTTKFPDIAGTVTRLKAMGFRVTLWIHPFINKGCEPIYSEAKALGYFVADHNGNVDTQWWNSQRGEAAYIDFTKEAAANWYYARLQSLLTATGIDSFKFDAGETSWAPPDPQLVGTIAQQPTSLNTKYIDTVARFGDMVEVRSGAKSQHHAIYMRMLDKESNWGWDAGLPTLVTTLLQLNMNGYPFVLPDMVGGNGYNNQPPSAEMLVRWLQATVFMPSLQFSYLPWDYKSADVTAICREMTELHASLDSDIKERFALAVSTGEPVNPPIWWLDPTDKVAQGVNDEFLLGVKWLAAPILNQGQTSRDIYLPKGQWMDGNDATMHTGPKWLRNYAAPLTVLPHFRRVSN